MASTAKLTDVLREEVQAPTRMYKKYAVKHWVRLENNAAVLAEVSGRAVPAVQRMIMNQLLLQRETKALDLLAERHADNLPDVLASYLHGCSAGIVRKALENPRVINSKSLRGLLGKFHWELILERLEAKVEKEYKKDYVGWSSINEEFQYARKPIWNHLIKNSKFTAGLWDLLLRFPQSVPRDCVEWPRHSITRAKWKQDDPTNVWKLPTCLNIDEMTKRHPDKWLQYWGHMCRFQILPRHFLQSDEQFQTIYNNMGKKERFATLKWFMETYMAKDALFPELCHLPLAKIYDTTWRGRTTGRGKTNPIGGVLFCVNKAQTFDQIGSGFIFAQLKDAVRPTFDWLVNSYEEHSPGKQLEITKYMLGYFDSVQPSQKPEELMYWLHWIKHLERLCTSWSKKLIARGEKLKKKQKNLDTNPWQSSIDVLESKADEVVDMLLGHPWRMEMESRVTKLVTLHEKITAALEFWKELVKQNPGYRATQDQEAIAKELQVDINALKLEYRNKFIGKHPLKTHLFHTANNNSSNMHGSWRNAVEALQETSRMASDAGLVDRLNEIWSSWSVKFENMDLPFEKVIGKQKKRTLMKTQLEAFQKQIEQFVFAEVRAAQNYDIILKDFAYRRFARAKQESKPKVTARTWKVYMFMMPPAMGKDFTKFDEYLYGMRKERWMHLVNNFVTGVFRYSMKKNRVTKPYGYDLYHSILSEVINVWTATDRSKCYCNHAADAYIGILTGLYKSRELPKDGDEKQYVPVEKVVSITEEWLALVLGLEPTEKEDIDESWFEWRNWILEILDKITFGLLATLKTKQDKVNKKNTLETEKVVLREDIDYLTKLGHRLYQALLKLHKDHGIRFEEKTYGRLVPFCEKVIAFEESIQIDLLLRNERWMTKSVKVVEKICNLMGKKAWSKNPLNSDGLVTDLEVAWERMNQRLIDVLKEKEFRERRLAARERGEEFTEVEDTKKDTKMAQFFDAFKGAGKSVFSNKEAKALASAIGLDTEKLVEASYSFRAVFTSFQEDLEAEEEGLAKETPPLPPVSNKTAVQMQTMKSTAEYCMTRLRMFFDQRRSKVVRELVQKMHQVPVDFLPMMYTDLYETIYPLYNGTFETLKIYYKSMLPSMTGVLISKKTKDCEALYRKLMVEGIFKHYLKEYEELCPKKDESARNGIIVMLFTQLHHCKRDMARELYEMIVDKEMYNELFLLMRDYFYKDTDFFRELFSEFLKFRRRKGDDFESKCNQIIRKITDQKLKEEIFLKIVEVKRMVKVCENQRSLVLDLLKQGISCYNSKVDDDTYTPAMRDRVTDVIVAIIEANKSDEGLKELLDPLLDVTNNKIRRALTKSADSSSAQQRVDVLERLAKATDSVHVAVREKELARTLSFVGKKLKNESLDNRTSGLAKVFNAISDVSMNVMLKNKKCRDVILEMLQDSLDSVSLDESSAQADWEKKFRLFSRRALKLGGQDLTSGLVDFGFEIQWRIMKHRLGEKPCAKQFLVNFGHLLERKDRLAQRLLIVENETEMGKIHGNSAEKVQEEIEKKLKKVDIYFPEENEEGFIMQVMKAYDDRKKEIYPDYLATCVDEATHLMPLFSVVGQNWKNSGRMQKFMSTIMDSFLDMKFQWDDPDDSDLVAPELEVATANVLKTIVTLHPDDWYTIKEFDSFVNSVFGAVQELHVRGKDRCLQASQSLLLWMLRFSLQWALKQYKLRLDGEDIFSDVTLGEEWTTQPLMKTVIERCLGILQPEYPKNGPCFWSLEFEIHLAFRWTMTQLDIVDKKKLAKMETADLLPSLKVPLFVSYWKTLDDSMSKVLKEGAPPARVKNTIMVGGFKYIRVTDDDEKTLFDDDDEQKHYRTESVVWALDVLNQYCLGGSSHNLKFVYRRPKFLKIKGLSKDNIICASSAPSDPRCDWRWLEVQQLKSLADMSLQLLSTGWESDSDGLAIVPENHFVSTFFNRVIYLFHNPNCAAAKGEKKGYVHWDSTPVLKRFVEIYLRTRTCVKFVWKMYSHLVGDKKGKERWEARDKFVQVLLDISPSSIYIPLVWRHLLMHRQDLLKDYLDDLSRPYFGLFYLPSPTRPKTRFRLKEESSNPRAANLYTKSVSNDWSNCIKRIPLEKEALEAFEQDLEEWNAEKHDPTDRYDNREIWSFPACYNLTRLTPAMTQKIYNQKLAEAKNKSRSMGERVSSIQRLTLLPSVDLADVVSLIDAEDADWTTNILERLTRGAVYVDEITYGAHYILQPKLLSAQMARVAGFCLDPVLRYIPRDSFTKLMRLILSGERRKKMKVTVYKQMIRLLLKRINSKHVRMFKFEWGRGEVHRDVRVVIIKIALEMLRSDNPPDYVLKTAWHVLESTVWKRDMSHQQELITVVLGASGFSASVPSNLLTNPKLEKLFTELISEKISNKYWDRYVKRILLPTCERLHVGVSIRRKREHCRLVVPVAMDKMDEDMDKPVNISVKKKVEEDEEDWEMIDDEEELSVNTVSSEGGAVELAIMSESDVPKRKKWLWPATMDEAAPIYSTDPKGFFLCIDDSNLVTCGGRDDAVKWIDVGGYICTEDGRYMCLNESGALCVKKKGDEELPLQPQVCFRSDGAIMIDSHLSYPRSMDDLAYLALELAYKYLSSRNADELLKQGQVRLRLARMAFEVLSDMSLDFVYPDKRAWASVVNTRRTLALNILKKCVDPKNIVSGWSASTEGIDQRWMTFFKRGLDIAYQTLTTTDISPIRVHLLDQIEKVYTIQAAFGSKDYLEQCKSGFFVMRVGPLTAMYNQWLSYRARTYVQNNQATIPNMMPLLKDSLDFMGWQMAQLATRTEVKDVSPCYQNVLSNLISDYRSSSAVVKALVVEIVKTMFNDTLPVTKEVRAMKSYERIIMQQRNDLLTWILQQLCQKRYSSIYKNSACPPVMEETIDLHWNFICAQAKENKFNESIFNFYNTYSLEPMQHELLKRVLDKCFSTFDRYNPKTDGSNKKLYTTPMTKEEQYWLEVMKLFYNKHTQLLKFFFSNPDYINRFFLSSFCFSRQINDSKFSAFMKLIDNISKQAKPLSRGRVRLEYNGVSYGNVDQSHPILQYREIFLKSILADDAKDKYCFEGLSAILRNINSKNLINSNLFQDNLAFIYELCVGGMIKSGNKLYADRLDTYAFNFIKALIDNRGYEAWPQMENLIASLIDRAAGSDASLHDKKLANKLIANFPMMIWNQNAQRFDRIADFLVSSATALIEDEQKKAKEKADREASKLARAGADRAKRDVVAKIEREELFFFFFAGTFDTTITETETTDIMGATTKTTITNVREDINIQVTSEIKENKRFPPADSEENRPEIKVFSVPSQALDASKRILACITIPLEDREIKELPDHSKAIAMKLTERMLATKITDWEKASLEEINALTPGLWLFLCKTDIFQQVYKEDVKKTLEVFQYAIDMLINAPFKLGSTSFSFKKLINIICSLVGHTEHCDSYNDCYVPLVRLILEKMYAEIGDPGKFTLSAASNFTELWFKMCQIKSEALGEFFFEHHKEALLIFDKMYEVANAVYCIKDVPAKIKSNMKTTFIKFMEGIIQSRYSNWDITRVLGRVVPIMLKIVVTKAIEETSDPYDHKKNYFAFDLINDICSNKLLTAKAIAVCVGAELTGNLLMGLLLQEKNSYYLSSVCEKLLVGLFEATHEVVKIGSEPKKEGEDARTVTNEIQIHLGHRSYKTTDTDEDQEEDIRLHDDDVAVVERVLKAAEENLNDTRIRTRCMTCLRSVTARTRTWRGMTLNLYLDQREDIYMRVYKIYFDKRYDRGVTAKNDASIFLQQVWYAVNNKIRNPKECTVVTDKLLHYLKLISAFPVSNIEESDAMAHIQLYFVQKIGYITAGITDLYEPGPIDSENLICGAVLYVGREDSVKSDLAQTSFLGEKVVIEAIDLDAGLAQIKIEPTKEGEETQTCSISIKHLRKAIDQTSSGELKFSWNDQFVQMLKEFFANQNADVRYKAYAVDTSYGSKREWTSVDSSISSKIQMKQKKKPK